MLKKELIIGVFATSVILASFGTALAEDSNDKSILGTDEFTFNASETKADVAARNYVYDYEQLALIGTEAGGEIASTPQALRAAANHVYDEEQLALIGTEAGGEIASTPQALLAAANHVYDQEQLAVVGTEAGDWEYKFDDQGSGTSEVAADKRGTPSSNI